MAQRYSRKTKSVAVHFTAAMRVVVLQGPEPMLKKLRLDQLRDALESEHGELDPVVLDGRSVSLAAVFDEVRGYSLLQSYKLVIIDYAEEFVKTHRQAVERYAADPVDHATLVLRSESWRKGNLDKLIAKVGVVVRCDQPSEADAQRWAIARCQKEHKCALANDAAAALVQRVGPHLLKLDTEMAKLVLMVPSGERTLTERGLRGVPGGVVSLKLVEHNVQRGNEEQAWVVQEAVLGALASGRGGGSGGAIEKIHELVDLGGQAEVLVTYFVADLIRKLTVAQAMLAAGESSDSVAKAMKLWGPRRQPFFEVLRKTEGAQLRYLLSSVLEADARSKSGLGKPVRNLEGFCTTMADTIK